MTVFMTFFGINLHLSAHKLSQSVRAAEAEVDCFINLPGKSGKPDPSRLSLAYSEEDVPPYPLRPLQVSSCIVVPSISLLRLV